MDLIVTDGHEGLLAAASALFTATPRQRCVVHKQRNGPRTEIYVKIGYRENEQKPALLVIGLVLCSSSNDTIKEENSHRGQERKDAKDFASASGPR